MEQYEKERKDLYIAGIIVLGAAFIFLLLQILLKIQLTDWIPPCLFHKITGMYCPGCGGTRAVTMLFTGYPLRSMIYHPLVLYLAVLYLWFMVSTTIEYISKGQVKARMRYNGWFIVVGGALLALNFLIKNGAILLGYGSWITEILK